jgi:hypothetical protein
VIRGKDLDWGWSLPFLITDPLPFLITDPLPFLITDPLPFLITDLCLS